MEAPRLCTAHAYMLHAQESLFGKDAKGLSTNSICHLKESSYAENEQWSKRGLGRRCYVYVPADGVYCPVRMDGTYRAATHAGVTVNT